MGVDTYGWIEMKHKIGSHEGEWRGVIKVHPLFFKGLSSRDFRISLREISTDGLPADISDEVKADWDPRMYLNPGVLNWEDAWKIDTEVVYGDWWALVEMVDALSKMQSAVVKHIFRFVYWVD